MDIKLEEVQWFGFVSMLMGMCVFVIACIWDNVIGVTAHHNEGYGAFQITVIAASGLYTFWAYSVHLKWKEYRKMIHKMGA